MAVIISEYVEGSSSNKAIELLNTGAAPVDLSTFTLELYSNGNSSANATLTLSGTLAAGDTFVVSHGSADAAIQAVTDLNSSSIANFNGDDALVLKDNGVVIDSFGQVGTDPGSEWTGGGANDTLRRKDGIVAGDTNITDAFDASLEWDSFAQNTFDHLGKPEAAPEPEPFLLAITEIWPGNAVGDNLSTDWFEIKNTGATAYNAAVDGQLFYDDDSQDPAKADPISGIDNLAPGEVAIVVLTDDAAVDVPAFSALWGDKIDLSGVTIGSVDGSGLVQGGDGVTLWVGDPNSDGVLADYQAFPDGGTSNGGSYQVETAAFSTDAGEGDDIATTTANPDGESAIGNPGDGAVAASEPEPEPAGLVISEIMNNPASGEDNWEWVEVYNPGTQDIDMAGYVIDDGNSSLHSASNIAAGVVKAGGSAVLFNADDISAADFNAAWGPLVTLIPVTGWGLMGLNNSGDTVSIWDSFGDYVEDDAANPSFAVVSTTYPNIDDGAGSLYLTDLSDQTSWALSTAGTNTPVNNTNTSTAAGGNSGADVGSPTAPFDGPLPANTLSTALLSTTAFTTVTGDIVESEINAFDPATNQLFVTSALGVTIVDLSDPANPIEGALIDPTANGATSSSVTSVAVSPDGFLAMAVPDATATNPGIVQIYQTDGSYLTSFTVGALPDMLTFNEDGTKLVVANEGEPGGGVDPLGTVSIIEFDAGMPAGSTIKTVDFTSFDGNEAAINAAGGRIFPGNAVSTDVEPEYITIQGDTAFVALQEANAIATIDLASSTIVSLDGLGFKDHWIAGNELDASDRDDGVNITTEPLLGMYMPDAIASYTVSGEVFYITANEGDARDEDVRVKDLTLDPSAFPDAANLQLDENLGRIQVSSINGDTDGDGDFDQLFSYGARSFTIRKADGTIASDSGADFEQIMQFEGLSQEGRSDNKGPEPEGVVVGEIDGTTYAFIGLERTNAVVVYDVSDPAAPVYDQTLYTDGDISPEGLSFIAADDSPSGVPLLAVTNEVSGTLSVYQLAEPPLPVTKIHEIQGTDDQNTKQDELVTIEGIVVGDFQDGDADDKRELGGFFVQEEDADADSDAATSEGVFVFDDAFGVDVNVGDLVRVTGTADEFFGQTQIDDISSVEVISTGNALPTAADVSMPSDLESVEGMLVNMTDTLTINEMFNLDRFGEIRLVAGERPMQFTQTNTPDVAGNAAYLAEVAGRSIVYDDGKGVQNDPIGNLDGFGPTFSTATDIQMGDTIDDLSGVMTFGFGDFRLRSTSDGENTFDDSNPREAAPEDVGGSLKVASLNVLNYFTTLDDGSSTTDTGNGPRGADDLTRFSSNSDLANTDPDAEFDRQAAKIVEAIVAMDADILGLVELENSASDAAIADLVAKVNAEMGAGTYAYVATGLVGDDAITNGFIYKPSTVETTGDFAVLDETIDARFDTSVQRPALAQTFTEIASGESFTAAVNHLKSKGSIVNGEAAIGDGQGNNNPTRTIAAEALVDWLATDPTGSGDEDFMILGDLNAYAKEDPITAVLEGADDVLGTADDYTDLAQLYVGSDAYSYVFDGFTGTLDYALVSEPLLAQITGATEWHVNSDEPDAIDYNLDFGRDDAIFDGTVPFRNSDHDPVLVGLDLGGIEMATGIVRGFMFRDQNDNGIYNAARDARVDNQTVELLDSDGVVVASDTTDGDGKYYFGEVAYGDYSLRFDVPDAPEGQGFILADQGTAEGRDSDVTNLAVGTTDVFTVDTPDIIRFQAGITDTPTILPIDPDVTLALGIADEGAYGNKVNGLSDDDGKLHVGFDAPAGGAILCLTGFDIDNGGEITIFLNGVEYGNLEPGVNNGDATYEIELLASDLASGENIVTFENANPNWKWGISNLLLKDAPTEPTADAILLVNGPTETGEFGHKYNGIIDPDGEAVFEFNVDSVNEAGLRLNLTGFDVDSDNELSVLVNGNLVQTLEEGVNNGDAFYSVDIDAELMSEGANMLTVENSNPDWKWGVTDLFLFDPDLVS